MKDSDPNLLLDQQLCFLLYAASRRVTAVYKPLLQELQLTYPQYLTLLVLWEHHPAPCTVKHLGQRLQLDSGTLTPLLKRLEAQGRITRQRDPQDERQLVVQLTEAGAALRDSAKCVPTALLDQAQGRGVDNLPELFSQLKTFMRQLGDG